MSLTSVSADLGSRTVHLVDSCDESLLADLRPGDVATVLGYAHTDGRVARRFHDLGLAPGHDLRVVRRALFGGPVVVEVVGTELMLRRSDAAAIVVTRTAA